MQKQDSSCSCDFPLIRTIPILGEPVRVKNYICARDQGNYQEKPKQIKLQLTILPSKYCNARCPFCIAAPTDDPLQLDPDRLFPLLEQLRDEEIVRGITISGGEPSLDMKLLDRIIHMIFAVFGRDMELTLDINGTGIKQLKTLQDLYLIDAIHISRHHWDDNVNNSIFGIKMPSAQELADTLHSIDCPDLFVLNCLMLRGVVCTSEDIHRYMDFAIEMGAGKVSFITAAPVNPWTAEHRINYDDVLRDEDPQLLFTREYRDFDWCRCRDGVYVSPAGKLIEFYGRRTEAFGCDYCRGLVIGPDASLRVGFDGKILR